MGRFKSPRQTQRFLSADDQISAGFQLHPTASHGLMCSAYGTTMQLIWLPEQDSGFDHVAN